MAKTGFLSRLGVQLPIIQAPMGGGPSTPELVAAVSNAGGLGSLGAPYLTPEQILDAVRRVRALTVCSSAGVASVCCSLTWKSL